MRRNEIHVSSKDSLAADTEAYSHMIIIIIKYGMHLLLLTVSKKKTYLVPSIYPLNLMNMRFYNSRTFLETSFSFKLYSQHISAIVAVH